MRHIQFFVVSALLAVACGDNSVLHVQTGPGTAYPCGVDGVVCLDANGNVNHMCCPPNNTCGGGKYDVGCPDGYCCYLGTDDDLGGAPKMHMQRQVPEHT